MTQQMTDQEMRDTLRGMIADWNKLTDAQRAEATATAAALAADRYAEVLVAQATGQEVDYTGGRAWPTSPSSSCDDCGHDAAHLNAWSVVDQASAAARFIYDNATCWAENICQQCSDDLYQQALQLTQAS